MSNTLRYAHLAPDIWKALEQEARKGWIQSGIANPETVAEHTLKLLEIGEEAASVNGLSKEERDDLLGMLEVHDWPEAVVGDEVTMHGVDIEREKIQNATKFAREESAMKDITAPLGVDGEKIFLLWLRFETSDDSVAVKAREIDKFQAIERAFQYERDGLGPKGLGEEFIRFSPPLCDSYLIERLDRVRV